MQHSVYIKTSIPSFYFETRTEPMLKHWHVITRYWWDFYSNRYRLLSSQPVLDELILAPTTKAQKMLDFLRAVTLLDKPPGIDDVVKEYIRNRLVPANVLGDAYHLAFASMHAVDFLLTWNCRHLANANKIRHIAVINGRLGLAVPVITTPESLMPEARL